MATEWAEARKQGSDGVAEKNQRDQALAPFEESMAAIRDTIKTKPPDRKKGSTGGDKTRKYYTAHSPIVKTNFHPRAELLPRQSMLSAAPPALHRGAQGTQFDAAPHRGRLLNPGASH